MGVETRRPPLPAPTDISSADNTSAVADDLATDVSRQTEKTSYSIPEDGSPVTISTRRVREGNDAARQSQTSLLIEYFEGGKNGDKPHSRPSVRVRVTPSSRKNKTSNDHVQITETNRNRKPNYTRRISLGSSKPREDKLVAATDVSNSDISNLSDRPPVEVEVLQNVSDLSRSDISPNRRLATTTSTVSSMPPDSMIDGEPAILSPARRVTETDTDLLKTPAHKRSRSLSRERITQKATQKVMEKLKGESVETGKSKSSTRKVSKEEALDTRSPRRKSGRGLKEEELLSGTESSMLSSNVQRRSGDSHSIRSGSALSATSSINNPKLLQTVEDAIRRLILPELNALKEEQKTQRNRDKFERTTRDSMVSASSREDLRRRVSKTSSAPDITKPKVILSRHGEERDISVSGDSVRASKSSRRTSRESEDTVRDEERSHRRSSGSKDKHRHRTRDAVLAGAAGAAAGALTTAALKHHDSRSSVDRKERRKRRSSHSKSGSRATSITDSVDESYRKDILPLPMRSEINASELTRDSILTAESERDHERRSSVSSRGIETPLLEVSRDSPREIQSSIPRTPPRTPSALRQGVSSEHSRSVGDISIHSAKSDNSLKVKATTAAGIAAAAAAAAAVATRHHDNHDDYEEHIMQRQPYSPGRPLSPIQSVASYRDEHDVAHVSVPRSARSTGSISSAASSPSAVARTRKRPKGVSLERREDVIGQHGRLPDAYGNETPGKREVDDFFDKNHELNEQYRRELEHDVSPEESPINYKHMSNVTNITNDSMESPIFAAGQDLRGVGGRARYVATPLAVESAVASLHEPSSLSVRSSQGSPTKDGNFSEVSSLHEDHPGDAHYYPPLEETRAMQDMSPSKERWQQIKEQAQARSLSDKSQQERAVAASPHSARHSLEEPIQMGASALPIADDPMPEIGYGDDQSEVTTNPSEIKGPLGGYEYGDRSHWPTDPTPLIGAGAVTPGSEHDHFAGKAAAIAGGAAAAAIAAAAANRIRKEQDLASISDHEKRALEEEYSGEPHDIYSDPYGQRETIPESPTPYNPDEGYSTAHALPGDVSPAPFNEGLDRYTAAYDAGADPFISGRPEHRRHLSAQSHGMASPLYDSSTGHGMEAIQSKDIVALMDHLTVRDAQRNARDTEILVTLVRSAAEMRNQFEEMKRFIAEQDALVMQNTMQHSNLLGQKILQGPRPQPIGSPRVPRTSKASSVDEGTEDVQTKKKNVFKRAIKGLSMRSTNDLAKIEDMLMHLLNEVEGLKDGQAIALGAGLPVHPASLNSYENLRASGDPGYEPEGHAGTSSTPNHSGYLSNPSSSKPAGMHSGYQGHRISTVAEDEEFDERDYPNEERLLTPTQEVRRAQPAAQENTPTQPSEPFRKSYEEETTPKRKHKSNSSSIFGIPKISRWSKTTASSAPDTARKSRDRPYSDASRSGSDLHAGLEDDYHLQEDDRIRSTQSLAAEQEVAAARGYEQRPPSPLIPEFDDPKYQAHRNSLNLQHPQPRPGPTHRHQTHLESQAINFNNMPISPATALFLHETKSDLDKQHDQWGSNPSLILNRERPYSSHSTEEQVTPQRKTAKDVPLVPPKVALDNQDPYADVPGAGYVSPHSYSSGHLAPLAPIEEVRYSLETDGGRLNYTPSPRPTPMQTPQRKITGPRPMGSRSPSAQSQAPSQSGIGQTTSSAGNTSMSANIGTVRRKVGEPRGMSDKEFDELSSYRDSPVSETF